MGKLMIIIRDDLSLKGKRKKSATCSKREQSSSVANQPVATDRGCSEGSVNCKHVSYNKSSMTVTKEEIWVLKRAFLIRKGYRSNINQKADFGLFQTSYKIFDVNAPMKVSPFCFSASFLYE